MVKLSGSEELRFRQLAESIIFHPEYQKMKKLRAHGKKTVFEHSMDVARLSFKWNRSLKLNIDEKELITGALLHDFYLYDWHKAHINVPLFKMHGFTHPFTACKNAVRIFGINERTQNIIRSHMWPLTLRTVPSNKAAWLVCVCDKAVATMETVKRI